MQKLGRYDLIRVLGKGAMGMVYEGRDPNLDRRVAIKTIRVENLSAEEAADYEVRFRTEARSVARLQHPHIVTVFDSDRDGDVAYLVMEFVDGDDLKHHLDRGEVYTLAQTLGLMGDLLSAMDYAHRQGIVHRDIKPANLLMEPSGRLKLTDFGVARIQDSGEATRTQGSMVGTLKYMSPEQVQGRPIDARSDLFAAGVVLYQLLTSKRPFDGVTDFDVIQNIISNPPVLPSVITPGLPAALDAVVLKALEKSRDDRYATAQEFHDALVAAVHTGSDQTISPQARPAARKSTSPSLGSASPPFAPPQDSSSSTTSSVVTQEVELVYWKDIKDSNDVDDLEEFLRKFPKGIYADLARRKLKRLGTLSNGVGSDTGFSPTMVVKRPQAPVGPDDATVIAPPPASERPVVDDSPAPVDTAPEVKPPVNEKTDGKVIDAQTEARNVATEATQPASRASAKVLGLAGAGVAALALVAYFFASGSPEPAPELALTPAQLAASEAAAAASAPAPAVSAPASAASAPATAASLATPPSALAASASASSTEASSRPKPLARASAPSAAALQSSVRASAPKAPVPSPVAKAVSEPVATPHPVQHAPSAPEKSSVEDPTVTCEGRWFLSYQICMSKECAKPELAQLPICVERKAQERRNLERAKSGN